MRQLNLVFEIKTQLIISEIDNYTVYRKYTVIRRMLIVVMKRNNVIESQEIKRKVKEREHRMLQ